MKKFMGVMLLALLMCVFSCNKDEEVSSVSYRDTLNVALTAQPPTLDPATTTSMVALDVASNFYETLYAFDKNLVPVPMLAESYTSNENNTEFVFKLRQGVLFHDGTEMKADDVVASMNYWLVKSIKAVSILGKGNWSKVDEYTVKVNFENPTNDLLNLMCSKPYFPAIRPKKNIDAAGEKGVTKLIGTGPYKVQEVKQDQYILLVKNEQYSALNTPPSGFAGNKTQGSQFIKYLIVTDESTRVNGLLSGEYDVVDSIPAEQYSVLKANPNLQIFSQPGGTTTLFFNLNQGIMSKLKMRQAIAVGMNCHEIMLGSCKEQGLFVVDQNYVSPSSTLWVNDAGTDVYNKADISKAKTLIQESGYAGEKIRLLTTKDYMPMYDATIVLQSQLQKLGLKTELLTYDFPGFMATRKDRSKWELCITTHDYQIAPHFLSAVNPGWAGNLDAKLIALVDSVKKAKNQQEATANWKKCQDYMYHQSLASYAIGQYNNIVAINKKVKGFVLGEASIVWNAKVAE